jgi:hypothetical protein
MRGRLRQLFFVLSDDNIGSGPRPEPHSLQDPLTSYPQSELVEQAVETIRQDHMYTAGNRSTPKSSQSNQKSSSKPQGGATGAGSGSKRKSDDETNQSGKKR